MATPTLHDININDDYNSYEQKVVLKRMAYKWSWMLSLILVHISLNCYANTPDNNLEGILFSFTLLKSVISYS